MAAQRGGYTVVSFIVDVSPSMGKIREVDIEQPNGELKSIEMTNLQWGLQYVKLKIQEMIYNGRKTDQCSVILFGTEDTKNILAPENEGFYDHVTEFIPIAQPHAGTLAKLSNLETSAEYHKSDALDAVVVAAEQQSRYLGKKKWTRKIIVVTDGENGVSEDDWDVIANKLDNLNVGLTIIGIDFDDEEIEFAEIDKSDTKRQSEEFYHRFTNAMNDGIVGTCSVALEETARPEMKIVKSTLTQTVLRIGDVDARPDEALELPIQLSKYTAVARPKGWKKYALRVPDENAMEIDPEDVGKDLYAKLQQQSEYYIDPETAEEGDGDEDVKMEPEDDVRLLLDNDDEEAPREINYTRLQKVEREELIRGYKYGTTFVPCPEEFPRLPTRKGMDLCGFFKRDKLRRDYLLGEVSYVWGGKETRSQKLLSSIVQAMDQKNLVAIVRSVSRDGMDPKMGVLVPQSDPNLKVDFFTWVQMPFADDVRKYTFPSLFKLVNKAGKEVTEHPFLPTEKQLESMEKFVDAMDLMDCGAKDEEGNRKPWYDPTEAYNPALYRVKQAMFHCAVVDDVAAQPVGSPHPDTLTFFEPPKRAIKRAKEALEECKDAFNVKQVTKRVGRARKDGHSHAVDDGDDSLLLDSTGPALERTSTSGRMSIYEEPSASTSTEKAVVNPDDDLTEDESDEELILNKGKKPATPPRGPARGHPLPTPARSMSPDDVETDKAPGRIIGDNFPMRDFKKNIAQGDIVSKAVEDLSAVVLEILMRPFASRRKEEMLECLEELRKTCLEEDEIEAWNKFLPELKAKCLSKPGNPDFWKALQEVGRDVSLISKNEAKQQGGESAIGENEATEFIS